MRKALQNTYVRREELRGEFQRVDARAACDVCMYVCMYVCVCVRDACACAWEDPSPQEADRAARREAQGEDHHRQGSHAGHRHAQRQSRGMEPPSRPIPGAPLSIPTRHQKLRASTRRHCFKGASHRQQMTV